MAAETDDSERNRPGERVQSPPGEPVRRGEGAEGFPHGSKYPPILAAGLFFTGAGLSLWLPLLVIGIPMMLYGIGGWTYEYAIEEYERGIVPEQKRQLLGIKSGYIAMILLISGELLIFAGLFVTWFYLDATRGPFPPPADPTVPEALPTPDLLYGGLMTLSLLVAGVSMGWARRSISRGKRSGLNYGIASTLVFGVVFLVFLGLDWASLIAAGVNWTTGPYGAIYYALTGVHAAHLLAGLALVGIVAYRAWGRKHFSAERHLMVSTVEGYWYFLAFVEVLIFAFIYFPLSA